MLDIERIDDIRHKDHLRIYYLSGEILELLKLSIKSIFIEKYSCCLIRSNFMRQSNIQHTVSIDKLRLFPFQQNVNKSRL